MKSCIKNNVKLYHDSNFRNKQTGELDNTANYDTGWTTGQHRDM